MVVQASWMPPFGGLDEWKETLLLFRQKHLLYYIYFYELFQNKSPIPAGTMLDQRTHGARGAVVHLPDLVKNHIFDEDGDRFQDERHKQMHVDVVPRAVEFSAADRREKQKYRHTNQ